MNFAPEVAPFKPRRILLPIRIIVGTNLTKNLFEAIDIPGDEICLCLTEAG